MTWLAVFFGGGLGALLRFGTGKIMEKAIPGTFPLATLISNCISCAVFVMFITLVQPKLREDQVWPAFFLTGLCGGYSTFSAFSYETVRLFKENMHLAAGLNIFLNLFCCGIIFWVFLKKI